MALRNYSSSAAQATLSAGVDASATTLSVSATTGFPATPFVLAVDADAAAQELVLVTNVAGTNLTVTRGYDSTVAASHSTGAVVQHSHAAIDFREANTHVNTTSGAHGASGAVMGANDVNAVLASYATKTGVETLTNKTLTAPVIDGTVLGTTFGAWGTWTPTLVGFTVSASEAYYKQVGKTVTASYTATVSGVTSAMAVSLPKAAARAPVQTLIVGGCYAMDAGTANRVGAAVLASTTAVAFVSEGGVNYWGVGAPFSWAIGDSISFTITYEAA